MRPTEGAVRVKPLLVLSCQGRTVAKIAVKPSAFTSPKLLSFKDKQYWVLVSGQCPVRQINLVLEVLEALCGSSYLLASIADLKLK